jgi:hypothetical protein
VAPSRPPHSPQNFAAAGFAAPQVPQTAASGVPHSRQNLRPGSFCAPQLVQVTEIAPLLIVGHTVAEGAERA